ncbi:DUF4136 domain-containing protein [Maribacter sp. ACAM166]|uniref:DUF4136 domain-containing protein n=1 Tax=Maribacter sp. ACAM166 TaxID=2508996 RepID=UPI0010FD2AB3|nr:DUF4136 domain-containing protein [Maribacter sp. ACAM166]TLP81773.1 DUF4136 domain-containing protein [Maribacter sp. ACAM166]
MQKIAFILGFILLSSCSSTQFVDSWKNREITTFQPQKLLVIGMTNNLTARKIFEEKLSDAFVARGIDAQQGASVLDRSFTSEERSEQEIDAMKDKLLAKGFDAVAITAVVGVDDKTDFSSGYYDFGNYYWYRFGPYYYRFQNVYFTPDYYSDYKVYHVETSIYNLKADEEKSLVWVGTFNIVDPSTISSAVNDYVNRTVKQLEQEGVVKRVGGIQ